LTNKLTGLKTQALQWLIDTGLPALQSGFAWLKDNIPTVATVITGLTAATVANTVAKLAATAAENGMTLAQYAAAKAQDTLNKSMLANPISLIILAITALVAAFVYLWNNCEAFREFFVKLWAGLKATVKGVADWFVNTFKSIGEFFSKIWSGFVDGAKNAWQGVKNIFSSVANFFKNIFSNAWQGVKSVFSTGGKIFDGIKDGIVKAFKTVVNAIIRGINKVVSLPFKGLNTILDKIHGISIAGVKPFSWLNWRAPIPQLPELATGGVVKEATAAVIGEDGAEAVMPLEKNTGWIKKLAKEIAAEQGNGVTINQTNHYKQAYTSPIEKYKSKQQLFAAARLIKAGAI
jgi:phage-related protein